jgi:hypothetical protein
MANIVGISDRSKKRFELIRFGSIKLNTQSPYLIKNLLPANGLVLIWGPPKCGKSFWAYDAAMHVALEIPYRGLRTDGGVVVYVALEGGFSFANRCEAWRQYHQIADCPFYLIIDRLYLTEEFGALCEDIHHQTAGVGAVRLIVIDTLNRSLLGSENKDEDMGAYIKAADLVRARFDCTVAVVHHSGVEASRPRGHTSLTGAVDAQIAITRGDDRLVRAQVEWMKDGTDDLALTSRLEPVSLGLDENGEPLSSCVCIPVEGAPAQPAKTAKPPPKNTRLLLRILDAELANGTAARPFADGPNVIAADLDRLRDEFYRQTSGENPTARRQAFHRAVRDAQAANLVAMRDNFVWRT